MRYSVLTLAVMLGFRSLGVLAETEGNTARSLDALNGASNVVSTQKKFDSAGLTDPAAPSGACAHSVFETRVPWIEWSNESSFRLNAEPARHPDRNICGTFAGRDSCCTTKTLDDFIAWSDAMDSSMSVVNYVKSTIERDPRLLVDRILITIRSTLPQPESVDWQKIRLQYRERFGKLITDWSVRMFPAFTRLWSSMVTYQEGLLCSACEPNFARFMDPTSSSIKIRDPAAADVGDAAVSILAQVDALLTDPDEQARIKDLAKDICIQFGGGTVCYTVPTIVSTLINYFTNVPLRNFICGYNKGQLPERNEDCKKFFMTKVLRGLTTDTQPIVTNIFDYLNQACPKGINGVDCSQIDVARAVVNRSFFTFDERPLATNVYTSEGYDVHEAACHSNLSGYACGGSGPKPPSHKEQAPSGNSGAIIITLVVLITLAAVGGVLFVSRHRIVRVTQTWYTRMRDQDDGLGPTVGLV